MKTRWLTLLVLPLVIAASRLPAREPSPPARPVDRGALPPAPVVVESPHGTPVRPPLTEREPRTLLPRIEDGRPIRQYVQRSRETNKDYRLKVDLSGQRLSFDVPELEGPEHNLGGVLSRQTCLRTVGTDWRGNTWGTIPSCQARWKRAPLPMCDGC